MKRVVLAAAFAASTLAAGASSAATISVMEDISQGQFVSEAVVLNPGDTAEFTFTALEDVSIGGIGLAGTGNNNGDDLENVTFGFTAPPTNTWTTVVETGGGSSAAFGSLGGLSLLAGESFTIFWADGFSNAVGVTASFAVVAPSIPPIPLPAGGFLLIGALAALGVARRKA